jgi:hypothetical protein
MARPNSTNDFRVRKGKKKKKKHLRMGSARPIVCARPFRPAALPACRPAHLPI